MVEFRSPLRAREHHRVLRRRPFANADAMNRAMVERWNDVVADTDEVWILGDLVMGQLTVNLSAHVWRLKGRRSSFPATTTPAGRAKRGSQPGHRVF